MTEAPSWKNALGSLPLDGEPDLLVDWLELRAFLSGRIARISEITGRFEIQVEEENEDNAEQDIITEQLKDDIWAEIDFRTKNLDHTYPFILSDDGESLKYNQDTGLESQELYVFCLIVSHMHKSPILMQPPTDENIRDVRKRLFQIVATLAVSGNIGGPAVSLGWPRESGETILATVRRALKSSGAGVARTAPSSTASPAAKDGGVDVLGWEPSKDNRPPPSRFVFGQAASGNNWRSKPVFPHAESVMHHYMSERPTCNLHYVTVCPLRLSDDRLYSASVEHREILDRTRTPYYAIEGLRAAGAERAVDEVKNIGQVTQWVTDYRNSILRPDLN